MFAIESGVDHTILLTKNNELFGCGQNTEGQLGLGDFKNRSTFERIPNEKFDSKIVQISLYPDVTTHY